MHLSNIGSYSALKAALAQISLTAAEELKEDNITVSVVYPTITATDFEKNTIKDAAVVAQEQTPNGHDEPMRADSAEWVAGLIAYAIETGDAEVFAHDWMRRGKT